jgi:hypothetical protein
MPDPIGLLRYEATILDTAVRITKEHDDTKTALALEQLAAQLRKQADQLASNQQWTGTHPGDTAGP